MDVKLSTFCFKQNLVENNKIIIVHLIMFDINEV